ncbi:unnamed protein product [Caenorhabditis brenneri]
MHFCSNKQESRRQIQAASFFSTAMATAAEFFKDIQNTRMCLLSEYLRGLSPAQTQIEIFLQNGLLIGYQFLQDFPKSPTFFHPVSEQDVIQKWFARSAADIFSVDIKDETEDISEDKPEEDLPTGTEEAYRGALGKFGPPGSIKLDEDTKEPQRFDENMIEERYIMPDFQTSFRGQVKGIREPLASVDPSIVLGVERFAIPETLFKSHELCTASDGNRCEKPATLEPPTTPINFTKIVIHYAHVAHPMALALAARLEVQFHETVMHLCDLAMNAFGIAENRNDYILCRGSNGEILQSEDPVVPITAFEAALILNRRRPDGSYPVLTIAMIPVVISDSDDSDG